MNKEILYIATLIRQILNGDPWFGRSAEAILAEVDPALVYDKPNPQSHSLIELLYHMVSWARFTQRSLSYRFPMEADILIDFDWRPIDPAIHLWPIAKEEFKSVHEAILELLSEEDDQLLDRIVNTRTYSFRFLLHGLIHHDIYHLGQIAYMNKLLYT